MRLASYNVNFGRPGHPRTLGAIRALDADIVFLQETNPAWERALGALTGYRHVYRHWRRGRAGGHGLLTRHPVRSEEVLDAPTGWFPAWRVVLELGGGPLQVLSVHLRPGFSLGRGFHRSFFATAAVRRHEIETHERRLDPALPTLILGDFNEDRGAALDYLGARGYRLADPAAPTWRFLHWRRRYDHIFAGPGVDVGAARVVTAGASDHLPLCADVKVGW
jgi:endonuclease/exonuclease/phosphatase family metal-dependent hydrolase